MRFECKGYGDCCRNLKQSVSVGRAEKFLSVKVLNLAVEPGEIALPLFDWEVERIREESESKNVYLGLKPLWVAISHKDQPVVVMWNADHSDCPFLKENKCSIYGSRPSICRSFPVTDSGLMQVMNRSGNIRIASSNLCRCWKEQIPDSGEMTVDEMYKYFYKIFGETYREALRYDMQMIFIGQIIQDLVSRDRIKPVYVDRKKLEKITGKGTVGFTDFLEIEKILGKAQLEKKLEEIDSTCSRLVGAY